MQDFDRLARHFLPLVMLSTALAFGCDPATESDAGTDSGPSPTDAGPEMVDAAVPMDAGCADCTPVLVDPDWLTPRLSDPGVQLVDARTADAYMAGRIPGAVHLEQSSLRETVDGVPGQVASMATLSSAISGAGVRPDALLVIYGDNTGIPPARVFWTFEYIGHAGGVAFLDGGYDRWILEGGSPDTSAPTVTPSTYDVTSFVAERRVVEDQVRDRGASTHLVDARTADQYGAGHIAGAAHIDWTRNVAMGSMHQMAELLTIHTDIDPANQTIVYCQTGSRASVSYLVLRHLGYPVTLYDGSWAQWSTLDDTVYLREP